MINLINQIYEIQRKADENGISVFNRNLERIFSELKEMGYEIEIPINKKYDENNTSLEVSLLDDNSDTISKVLKPIIYRREGDTLTLIQKGIAIIE